MARKSFVLRSTLNSGTGAHLRYPETAEGGLAARTDDESKLRADDLLIAPVLNDPVSSRNKTNFVSFFEAVAIDYTLVKLTWGAPLTATIGATPVATQVLLVYSPDGEPQTVGEGAVILTTNNVSELTHEAPSGKWAYYSLFVKFESNAGDLYYELATSLQVLVPKNYDSTNSLYNKIPEHYRFLDGNMDEGSGGPLYKYLSLFGFDLDRTRTELDYLITCKDPSLADSQVLDYLSEDLGVNIYSRELGASRLRSYINILGYLRRSNGTPSALEYALQALTGSDIDVDLTNKIIKIYAQRVNLLKDPNLTNVLTGLFDGGDPDSAQFSLSLDAGSASTTVFSPTYEGGDPSTTSFSVAGGSPIWSFNPDPNSSGSAYFLQTEESSIRVIGGDELYFSMHVGPDSPGPGGVVEVSLITQLSPSVVTLCSTSTSFTAGGVKYWKLSVPSSQTSYVSTYLRVKTTLGDASTHMRQLLLEREFGGAYFDGNTSFGGWLLGSSTISDYRWYNPAASNSLTEGTAISNYSIYNSNYMKTRKVVNRLLLSLLPVTELTTGASAVYSNSTSIPNPRWTVQFNHIPGVSYGV